MTDILARRKPATASNRFWALQQFFGYLLDEGEVDHFAGRTPRHAPRGHRPRTARRLRPRQGRRERACFFGRKTALAVDRYLRLRRRHSDADEPWLWIQRRGRLNDSGLATMLQRRGQRAGLGRIHPHQLRHTFAHAWLAAGGNEGDLMRLAGWRGRDMLSRYAVSAADERARDAQAGQRAAGRSGRLTTLDREVDTARQRPRAVQTSPPRTVGSDRKGVL